MASELSTVKTGVTVGERPLPPPTDFLDDGEGTKITKDTLGKISVTYGARETHRACIGGVEKINTTPIYLRVCVCVCGQQKHESAPQKTVVDR